MIIYSIASCRIIWLGRVIEAVKALIFTTDGLVNIRMGTDLYESYIRILAKGH